MPPGLSVVCLVLLALSAVAHHSHGNYQLTEYTELEGTVTEIHWINPHSWIYIEAADAEGETAVWALEGASVAELRRGGWAEDSIAVGDTISVRCHRLRDGSNGCLLGYVTPENGVEKLFD
jgi:hypothetical protein